MVRLSGTFSRFKPFKALVVGDFMLDTYTTGKVRRISPEAPVSVLQVEKQESRPGGAGNVVLNLISLGAAVKAVGRIGDDWDGKKLRDCLESEQVDTEGLLIQPNYRTPVKNRLIASSQQILRVDTETVTPIPDELEKDIIAKLPSLLKDVQVIALSDYGKGFLSHHLISILIQTAKSFRIPIIVDPKGHDFSKYKGADILKPNLSEAYAASKLPDSESLMNVAKTLLDISLVDKLIITRSEAGISVFDKEGGQQDFHVVSREVKDVTGAGDTVLAMISAAVANGLTIHHAAELANIAAGIAIECLGCARITLSELARRLLEYDSENKVFDESHLFALQQVLKGKQFTVLGLDSTQGMSTSLFQTLRTFSKREHFELIIYIRDPQPQKEFINLLSSLHEVDFIILQHENLKNLCEVLHPDEVFIIENGEVLEVGLHDMILKLPTYID